MLPTRHICSCPSRIGQAAELRNRSQPNFVADLTGHPVHPLLSVTKPHIILSSRTNTKLSRCWRKAPSTKSEQVSQTIPYLSIISQYLYATLPPSSQSLTKATGLSKNFIFFYFSTFSKNSFARTFSRMP